MNTDEETTMPNLLERARGLFTSDGDEPPTLEELKERRGEVRERIQELKDRIQFLESDRGRRELLQEVDGPEELGRRKRQVRDELEGLKDLDEELAAQQQEAEAEERAEELEETVTHLPELADEFEAAERRLREAREDLTEALVRSKHLHNRLKRRRREMPTLLRADEVNRLESMLDRLGANFSRVNGGPLGHLRSADESEEETNGRREVYDATTGETRVVEGEEEGPQVRRAEA